MDAQAVFRRICEVVKRPETYVPREYPTIGGMWTVDTWRKGAVTYQLMDEGYTERIMAPGVDVYDTVQGIRFAQGDVMALGRILDEVGQIT